jgi:hypothetical protein
MLSLIAHVSTSAQAAKGKAMDNYASINGLKMYYEIHGTGGTPLVLLHGGGSTIETTFGHILPMLAKKRQVIAFEQQGHGRTTDIADRPFTFVQSADDAAALLRHLKIDKADFFWFQQRRQHCCSDRHPSSEDRTKARSRLCTDRTRWSRSAILGIDESSDA